jgi:hypothetical protein
MSDRLAHLNQLLSDLEAQLAGLEKALALAPMEDKARLRLLVQEKQREMQPYQQEKAQLEAASRAIGFNPGDTNPGDIGAARHGGRVGKIAIESPEGQVPLESAFYVAYPHLDRCYGELRKPGGLLRLKSPHKMGKSSLMLRLLDTARTAWNYRGISIDLNQTNQSFLPDPERFMKWFCAAVGKESGIRVKTEDYWDDMFGGNDNATDYFEAYLLKPDDRPLVLAIDNFDRIFAYQDLEIDLCGLLRGWYERSKTHKLWEKLRLMIVHSQEPYAQRDINQSPFNVGFPVELGEFNRVQIEDLIQRHGLDWKGAEIDRLMGLIGGHPYLVRLGLYHLACGDFSLTEFLQTAPTEAGIYRNHLGGLLQKLNEQPALARSMKTVVNNDRPVRLTSEESFKLNSTGLVVHVSDNCVKARCQLYQLYFSDRLRDL